MKELFIPYELAVIAKEKRFNEPCFGYYDIGCQLIIAKSKDHEQYYQQRCLAPLYQQIVDWFEEKHKIEIYCRNYYKNSKTYKPEYECLVNGKQLSNEYNSSSSVILFPTKKKALDKAIEEALKDIEGISLYTL